MTTQRKILVTGGAGYIGSHVLQQLNEAGYDTVVYDNCSTGSKSAVLHGQLILGDLIDVDHLYQVMAEHQFDTVIHLAASLIAPESVARPLDYYANNTRNTLNLLRCCHAMKVHQLIFSSTAAVYGNPLKNPVLETDATSPINPYGRSKLMTEWLIQDVANASPLRFVILRYFNVAGADPHGRLGSISEHSTQLIHRACDAALGRQKGLLIYGTDYPTPDGTAIRDYIHVTDLASAHLAALHYLEQGHDSQTLNCGYGKGYSVRQVVDRVKAVSLVDFPVFETERRVGDPASVVACVDKISATLDWHPKYDALDTIVGSHLNWETQREFRKHNSPWAASKATTENWKEITRLANIGA